ncbi:polysialyltransferase family glycosyltransferase, partial [Streptomyces brasiliscabiei]|uniref:polysialyltransferase family glycosyltransferase n=1 Tax=Streptomyces brasiliscabiei TaxID=2736302 RepID=UPI001C11D792
VGTRIDRLLHMDLVPDLKPLLLTEFGVEAEIVPTDAFVKVLAELVDTGDEQPVIEEPALLLGQYLSALNILTAEEDDDLHVRILKGAVALGHTRVVFMPHPSAPARWSRGLE